MGFDLIFVPLTTIALSRIEHNKLTDATGLNSLFQQIGSSVDLAIFATLLGRSTIQAKTSIAAHLGVTNSMALAGQVARHATVLGFEKMFLLAGICFLAILPLLIFLKADRVAESGSTKPEMHLE